jgi:hypothetical protein
LGGEDSFEEADEIEHLLLFNQRILFDTWSIVEFSSMGSGNIGLAELD